MEACIFHNKRLGIAFKNVNGHNFLYHSKIHEHGTSIFRFFPNGSLFLAYAALTHKKGTKTKKICRSKFRFLRLERKSWRTCSQKSSLKPFAILRFLGSAWFPKCHFIWVNSAKNTQKIDVFYWFNSAKKGIFEPNLVEMLYNTSSNRGKLLWSLLLLIRIYSKGKILKKTDQ